MRLLLDTHAFLFWHARTKKLPTAVRLALEDRSNTVYLSLVSIWEIQLKHQLGKLPLPLPLEDLVSQEQRINGFELLPVEPVHVYGLSGLPFHHRDPFDRLLVAQAREEGLTLISRDPEIQKYSVSVLW